MRPLVRGQAPSSYSSGRNKQRKLDPDFVVADIRGSGAQDQYGLWRGYLIDNWGKYCSYCEIPMGTALQVEHKDPRSQTQNIYSSTAWDNLLLSCPSCNYTKKDHPDNTERLTDFVWPDGVDTIGRGNVTNKAQFCLGTNLSSFVYTLHTNLAARLAQLDALGNLSWQNLPPQDAVLVTAGGDQTAQAQSTIRMLKLNGGYDSINNRLDFYPQDSDRRVKHRTLAWKYALDAAQRLNIVNVACTSNSQGDVAARGAIERQIISTAVSAGFWSIWMTVFHKEYVAIPSRLALAPGDTIQMLLSRLFLVGNTQLDLRFTNTDKTKIGVSALGDIP